MTTNGLAPHDVMGQGPTMLFIHGTGADAAAWASVQAILGNRFRTVAYADAPIHATARPTPPPMPRRPTPRTRPR